VNLIAYLTPVIALMIGYFVGHEVVSVSVVTGAVLVFLGVGAAGRRSDAGGAAPAGRPLESDP